MMQAAIAAAPYCHPKYSTVVFKVAGEPGDDARDVTDVIEFFSSRASVAQSRGGSETPGTAARKVGAIEVPVERVVGEE
jgi:hypothetical protein